MFLQNKTFRYYYWIIQEFFKKHLKLILLSFFLSILGIVSVISFSPYLVSFTTSKKDIIGLVGNYEVQNIPDTIRSKISSGLLFINEKGEVVPVLTDSWSQSGDGKTYRFFLKKNLAWNDGKPFDAKGVSYKFKDVETKVINDHQIEFQLAKPLPIFASYLTTPVIKYPLIGVAGLYRVDGLKTQYGAVREIDLTPNKSNLSYLVYKFYDTETKMIDAYRLGEITQMTVTKKSVADQFSKWKNTTVEKSVDYGSLLTLFFNMNNEFLKQKDNRRAIANAISQDTFNTQGVFAIGPIPPTSWAYNPNLKKVPYDPDVAEKALRKTYDASQSGTLQLNTSYDYLDNAESVRSALDKTGLKVKINTLSFNQPSAFDLLLAFWKVPSDPDQYYFWHSTQKQGNIISYNNIKVDKLLEDGRNTTSVDERKKNYSDFQRTMLDDMPAYFLFYPYIYTVKRK